METRQLGKDLAVSAIGLGCMGLSTSRGAEPLPDQEAINLIASAVDHGVTLFDTAEVYGPYINEEVLGRALAPVSDRVQIATKIGFSIDGTKRGNSCIIGRDSRPHHIREAVEGSLRRLRVDAITLLYQHRLDPAVPIEDTVGAMADLVRDGKVRMLGLCDVDGAIIRRAHATHPIAAIQCEYSLSQRSAEVDVIPTCAELGIGLVPYSPLGKGLLGGSIGPGTLDAADWRSTRPEFAAESLEAGRSAVEALASLARSKGVTSAQLALAWLLHQGDFIVPIPGARRICHLRENIGAVGVRLDSSELKMLEKWTSELMALTSANRRQGNAAKR